MNVPDDELRRLYDAARRAEDPALEDRAAVRAALVAHGLLAGASVAAVTAAAASAKAGVAATAQAGMLAGTIPGGAGLGAASSTVAGAATSKGLFSAGTLLFLAGGLASGATVAVGAHIVSYNGAAHEVPASTRIARPAPKGHGAANGANAASQGNAPRTSPLEVGVDSRVPAETARDDNASAMNATVKPASAPAPMLGARAAASVPAEANGTSAPSLEQETRGLSSVQVALRDGRPSQALTLLDAQERVFARGTLVTERSAARVFALCALGRTEQARSAARRFLSSHPASPLAERVRASCAGGRAGGE